MQYADSIDKAVAILKEGNNGLYTNEWLLADTKTDEIAMFELGTHKNKLWRSGNDDWFGGTKGFYWGCNNAKDVEVRLETIPSVIDRPANVVWHPSDRDRAWLRLYNAHKGKIGEAFGFEAFHDAAARGISFVGRQVHHLRARQRPQILGGFRPSPRQDLGTFRGGTYAIQRRASAREQ